MNFRAATLERNDIMERILDFVSQPILRYSDIAQSTNSRRPQKPTQPAKRFDCRAKVMLKRGDRYVKGMISNISLSGAFLQSELKVFEANEKVTLLVKPAGGTKNYRLVAEVVRFTSDPRKPQGYGLRFCRPHELV